MITTRAPAPSQSTADAPALQFPLHVNAAPLELDQHLVEHHNSRDSLPAPGVTRCDLNDLGPLACF